MTVVGASLTYRGGCKQCKFFAACLETSGYPVIIKGEGCGLFKRKLKRKEVKVL